MDNDDMPRMVTLAVNIRKDSLTLEPENGNPGRHVVSFDLDASQNGRFSITYCGEENEANGMIVPQAPHLFPSIQEHFQSGMQQRFIQSPGTDLSLSAENVLSLLISAERDGGAHLQKQILHFRVEKNPFNLRLVKEILWEGDIRYEIREVYGADVGLADDNIEDCCICLASPRDALVMPCRHLCLCVGCAPTVMGMLPPECPICRDPISVIVDLTDFP